MHVARKANAEMLIAGLRPSSPSGVDLWWGHPRIAIQRQCSLPLLKLVGVQNDPMLPPSTSEPKPCACAEGCVRRPSIYWVERSRLRQNSFEISRETSTITLAPSVFPRSSRCKGPNRNRSRAISQSSVKLGVGHDSEQDQYERIIRSSESRYQRRAERSIYED